MEILVVVTIIGILAAIAVPSYIHAVEQGRQDACASNVHIITTQVERYRLERERPLSPGDLGSDSLVDYLRNLRYLVGEEIACPLGGSYVLICYDEDGNETDDDIHTQVVICTHDQLDE